MITQKKLRSVKRKIIRHFENCDITDKEEFILFCDKFSKKNKRFLKKVGIRRVDVLRFLTNTRQLPYKLAKKYFTYDDETGIITNRIGRKKAKAGAESGCKISRSYLTIMLKGNGYQAHRLAFLLGTGSWPLLEVDHIDHNRMNNSIDNLRDISSKVNSMNMKLSKINTSGVMGVSFVKKRGDYKAYITVDQKQIHLGYFNTVNAAAAARKVKEIELGFHFNHGSQH